MEGLKTLGVTPLNGTTALQEELEIELEIGRQTILARAPCLWPGTGRLAGVKLPSREPFRSSLSAGFIPKSGAGGGRGVGRRQKWECEATAAAAAAAGLIFQLDCRCCDGAAERSPLAHSDVSLSSLFPQLLLFIPPHF